MSGQASAPHIGTLNEKPLHAALKQWIAEPGDRFEVRVGRHVADIVRGDLVIEIQTGSAFPLRRKLQTLLASHPVHIVLPIAEQKTITTVDADGRVVRSTRSPKKGQLLDVFEPLISLREFLGDPNLSIEAVLVHIEEVRGPSAKRRRWKNWEVKERRLIEVFERVGFHHPGDYLAAIPSDLEEPFTTGDLARATGRPRRRAQQIAYCLREMGAIAMIDRTKAGIRYVRHYGGVG